MRTRRSPKNQERLFKQLFKGFKFPQEVATHYHTDDSGIFECGLGAQCKYKVIDWGGTMTQHTLRPGQKCRTFEDQFGERK